MLHFLAPQLSLIGPPPALSVGLALPAAYCSAAARCAQHRRRYQAAASPSAACTRTCGRFSPRSLLSAPPGTAPVQHRSERVVRGSIPKFQSLAKMAWPQSHRMIRFRYLPHAEATAHYAGRERLSWWIKVIFEVRRHNAEEGRKAKEGRGRFRRKEGGKGGKEGKVEPPRASAGYQVRIPKRVTLVK